jgi:hypothetical protein
MQNENENPDRGPVCLLENNFLLKNVFFGK